MSSADPPIYNFTGLKYNPLFYQSTSTYATTNTQQTIYALKTFTAGVSTNTLSVSSSITLPNNSIIESDISGGYVDLSSNQTVYGAKTFTDITTISNATQSTAYNNGALVVSGGIGSNGNLFVSGTINGLIVSNGVITGYLTTSTASSTYATITSLSSYLTTANASSTYAPLSSPALTNIPTAPTATTATNTTQIATTAFVQSNLSSYLTTANAGTTYAPLSSPALTNIPTAPTATSATNTTQIATTAFVQSNLSSYLTTANATSTYAPLSSPALTNIPTAPTATTATNTTQIATTAFVQSNLSSYAPKASPTFTGVITTNATTGLPSLGVSGGTGDKIILMVGTASIYPYSIGVGTSSNMWLNVPTSSIINHCVAGTNITTINATGFSVAGTGTFSSLLTASNGFTMTAGTLTLPSSSITQAMVSGGFVDMTNTQTSIAGTKNFTGSIGFGQTSPSYPIDVLSGTTAGANAVLLNLRQNCNVSTGFGQLLKFSISNNNFDMGAIGTYRENSAANYYTSLIFYTGGNPTQGTLYNNMILSSAGYLGIGNITSPQSNLHIHSTSTATAVRIQLTDATTTNASNVGFCIYKHTDESAYIWNYSAQALHIGTNNAEKITILSGGNVGINNNNPSYNLDVVGTCNVSTNLTVGGTLTGTSGSFSTTLSSTGLLTASNGFTMTAGTLTLPSSSITQAMVSGGFVDMTNTQTSIAGNKNFTGSIGFGQSSPSYPIDVLAGTTVGANAVLLNLRQNCNVSTGFGQLLKFSISNNNFDMGAIGTYRENSAANYYTSLIFYTGGNPTQGTLYNNMILSSAGYLGIGNITSPQSNLHIHSTVVSTAVRIQLTDATTTNAANVGFCIYKHTDESAYIWNYSAQALHIGTNNAEKITILSGGNVGINNNNPSTALDVIGTGKFSSTLTASSGFTMSAGTLSLPNSSITQTMVSSGYVDLSTAQTTIGGAKTFTALLTASLGFTMSAGTLTLPSSSITQSFVSSGYVDLSTAQTTIGGAKTFTALHTCSAGFTMSAGTLTLPSSSITQSFVSNGYVDLSSAQASIGGAKTFTALHTCSAGLTVVGTLTLPNNSITSAMISGGIVDTSTTQTSIGGAKTFTSNTGFGKTGPAYPLDVYGGSAATSLIGLNICSNGNTANGVGQLIQFQFNNGSAVNQGYIGSYRENNAGNYSSSLVFASSNNGTNTPYLWLTPAGGLRYEKVSTTGSYNITITNGTIKQVEVHEYAFTYTGTSAMTVVFGPNLLGTYGILETSLSTNGGTCSTLFTGYNSNNGTYKSANSVNITTVVSIVVNSYSASGLSMTWGTTGVAETVFVSVVIKNSGQSY